MPTVFALTYYNHESDESNESFDDLRSSVRGRYQHEPVIRKIRLIRGCPASASVNDETGKEWKLEFRVRDDAEV